MDDGKAAATNSAEQKSDGRARKRSARKAGEVPETKKRILAIATEEFSSRGYDGARIDVIMTRSKVSKNLIYHYFGAKEKLFIAVLEEAYVKMHTSHSDWPIDTLNPTENIRELVRMIFRRWQNSPQFIGLLNSENFYKGKHIQKAHLDKSGYATFLKSIEDILKQGAKDGAFRPDIDPVELYVSISSLAYHLFSNQYTLSLVLNLEYNTREQLRVRRDHIEDLILTYVKA